jgi:hypothetical protein
VRSTALDVTTDVTTAGRGRVGRVARSELVAERFEENQESDGDHPRFPVVAVGSPASDRFPVDGATSGNS